MSCKCMNTDCVSAESEKKNKISGAIEKIPIRIKRNRPFGDEMKTKEVFRERD
ncbi:hypothetical protein JYU34_009884, partial [Plutella xylostella]